MQPQRPMSPQVRRVVVSRRLAASQRWTIRSNSKPPQWRALSVADPGASRWTAVRSQVLRVASAKASRSTRPSAPILRPDSASTWARFASIQTWRLMSRPLASERPPTPLGGPIILGRNRFAPHTNAGSALPAHELTKVSQHAQHGDPRRRRRCGPPTDKRKTPRRGPKSGGRTSRSKAKPVSTHAMCQPNQSRWSRFAPMAQSGPCGWL